VCHTDVLIYWSDVYVAFLEKQKLNKIARGHSLNVQSKRVDISDSAHGLHLLKHASEFDEKQKKQSKAKQKKVP